ncbi:MAG: hypothetical protein JSS66_15790 [Armatimonadetes bacterium]|nr:hypothetical protein [Armatimonadota bacterium]
MLWVQASVCFVLWTAFGIVQARSKSWRRPVSGKPLLGALSLIGGGAVLVLGLFCVASLGGLRKGVLVPWAWCLVLVTGLAFVYAQGLGAAILASAVILSGKGDPPRPTTTQEDPS